MNEFENYQFVSFNDRPNLDLAVIQQAMSQESCMLHPSLRDIEASYRANMAMVMLYSDQPVGYMRYEEILNPDLIADLGLPDSFPPVWEMGSVIITPDHRGRHLGRHLADNFLNLHSSELTHNQVLLLGTTKEPKVLSMLIDIQQTSLGFWWGNHLHRRMVATFTCICSGEFGCGFQNRPDGSCPSRIRTLKTISTLTPGQCAMFVFNPSLADQMETQLNERFVSQSDLINQLRKFNYYDQF